MNWYEYDVDYVYVSGEIIAKYEMSEDEFKELLETVLDFADKYQWLEAYWDPQNPEIIKIHGKTPDYTASDVTKMFENLVLDLKRRHGDKIYGSICVEIPL